VIARVLRVFLIGVALLAGCTSTPQATSERDAEAKRFLTRPDAAKIYVFRPDLNTADMGDTVLHVDDQLIGTTLPRTFFVVDVYPGPRVVRAVSPGTGQISIDAEAAQLYFVELNTLEGGSPLLRRVNSDIGKREILRCCSLMENWTPGQRPFLR
jgi:hypothetical protein